MVLSCSNFLPQPACGSEPPGPHLPPSARAGDGPGITVRRILVPLSLLPLPHHQDSAHTSLALCPAPRGFWEVSCLLHRPVSQHAFQLTGTSFSPKSHPACRNDKFIWKESEPGRTRFERRWVPEPRETGMGHSPKFRGSDQTGQDAQAHTLLSATLMAQRPRETRPAWPSRSALPS